MVKKESQRYVVLVDSSVANLGSVFKALKKVGVNTRVSGDSHVIREADGVVFPGVGSFAQAMLSLEEKRLNRVLVESVASGKPFLGICLGLQVLFASSEESSEQPCENNNEKKVDGLNMVAGEVKHFPPGQPVPHVGWNRASLRQVSHPLFAGLPEAPYFYFTHSYYVHPLEPEVELAVTNYGIEFVSAIARDNLMGVQFHPEKSGPEGLHLLNNFGNIVIDP